jgi:hypothetical protein
MRRGGQDLPRQALALNGKKSLQRFAVRTLGLLEVNQ